MKKAVALAALFTVGYSFTKVTINANNFIEASDVVQMGYDDNPSITHTTSGPNQTWDYGELSC
jgi:hypothetical protein